MKPQYPPGPRDWCFGLTFGLRSLREPCPISGFPRGVP